MQFILEHFGKSFPCLGLERRTLGTSIDIRFSSFEVFQGHSVGARPVADGTMRAPALGCSEHCSKNRALTCLEARQERGSMFLGTLPYSDDRPALVYL
jgi:hypothetical protein